MSQLWRSIRAHALEYWLRRPKKADGIQYCCPNRDGQEKLSESVFSHINRSARRGDAASRDLIEEWLKYVPTLEQGEFCTRFRSGDDIQFAAAFQELFLHVWLARYLSG
jgi:hypothetical protein